MSGEEILRTETAEAFSLNEQYEAEATSPLAELSAYLGQYGEMIVISPRLPGVPLPLASLINACPKPPTDETAPEFLAEARMLVAAAEAKKPEAEEGDDEEPEEDSEEIPNSEDSKKKLI